MSWLQDFDRRNDRRVDIVLSNTSRETEIENRRISRNRNFNMLDFVVVGISEHKKTKKKKKK